MDSLNEGEFNYEAITSHEQFHRLDLGAGVATQPGFVGVDRFGLPGISVICDLNAALPFRSNSADLVYASHSLEHVDNLLFTMNEIYRVCKHQAQVCIVAPYSAQSLNIANPYHKQSFNEHTPRFWTDTPFSLFNPLDYEHPNSPYYGLSRSDNGSPDIDIRCIRMEFFYFPEYRDLPEEEKRDARQKYQNVCDQIMYHLIVVKEAINTVEIIELATQMVLYEPAYITERRQQRKVQRVEDISLTQGSAKPSDQATLDEQLQWMQQRAEQAEAQINLLQADLERQQSLLETTSNESSIALQENSNLLLSQQTTQHRAEVAEAKLARLEKRLSPFLPVTKKIYKNSCTLFLCQISES